jgi:hypothetical protein
MDEEVKAWREMYLTAIEHVPRGQKQRARDAAMAAAMAYCWPQKRPDNRSGARKKKAADPVRPAAS